ncbi:hypothetical protein [Streptomyces sp. TS71-3]|uniref:hypothetical protein n=1 Tax=Streptomyces sp. TS71-3 TaxID=2733862 RepID=UPI001B0C3E7C|nr:hypothetical protein [Streptomyces sp. TS71-3]GHJ35572.1 hypothetical protein Sm713_11810 [Streptomyces sp. TS71-3]
MAWGEGANSYADDSLLESGACVSDTRGGPYPYFFEQATLGPVVVGVSACGGRGREEQKLDDPASEALAGMVQRVQQAIGRDTGPGSAAPSQDTPAGGTKAPGTKERS